MVFWAQIDHSFSKRKKSGAASDVCPAPHHTSLSSKETAAEGEPHAAPPTTALTQGSPVYTPMDPSVTAADEAASSTPLEGPDAGRNEESAGEAGGVPESLQLGPRELTGAAKVHRAHPPNDLPLNMSRGRCWRERRWRG